MKILLLIIFLILMTYSAKWLLDKKNKRIHRKAGRKWDEIVNELRDRK